MKKLKTILIATAVAAVVIPSLATTTNIDDSVTFSLTGYLSPAPTVTTNLDKLTVTTKYTEEKFKVDTANIIANLGLAIGKTFTSKAKMAYDGDAVTITDGDVKTVIEDGQASVFGENSIQLNGDDDASSSKGSSTDTYASAAAIGSAPVKSSGSGSQRALYSLNWRIPISATKTVSYDLSGVGSGSVSEKFDNTKSPRTESYSESSSIKVSGLARTVTTGEGGSIVDVAVSGTVKVKNKYTEN